MMFSKKNKIVGCLKDKTVEMVEEYFSGLVDFIDTDRLFFLEQYSDLTKWEQEQFTKWFATSKFYKKC